MSANCNYSKKFLPLIKWHWDAVNRNVDAFKAWLSENFLDDPNTLYNQLAGSLGVTVERTSNIGSKKLDRPMIQGRMTLDETKTSYKDAFVGRTDLLIALEQRFKTDVVSKSVFDINNNVFIEASMIDTTSGLTVLNKNIVDYKQSLINALYNIIGSESINLSYDMSANDFQRAINQTLADYQTWKNSHPGDLKGIQEYTILSKFDEMLEKLAPFVAPKNEALLDSPNRYEYKGPTVKHYTNYGERNASIESQTSDLARILLSVLPEVELIKDEKTGVWREQVVDGSFIGLSGFNASMMALKQEILFGSKLNPELSQQYYNGANIDLGKLISAYLTILQGNKQSSNAAYFDMRQTFLLSKLRGLNRFIFNNKDLANSEMGKLLLDDMKSMFFKTEAVSYRGYAYDNELGKLIGRNLRSNFISTQKFQLADAIRGAVNFLKNDSTEQEALRKKYNIKVTGSSVSFSNGDENLIIMVNGNLKKNNHSFTYHGNASNIFVEELVGDVMQYIIPDNYYRVGSQMESDFNFIKDWAPLLAITVLGIYNDNTIPTEKGLVNLSGYNNYLLKAAKKLSVIYGAETTNVIKNPNGDKIPLFQLTNLTYNTKQLLYNLKKDRNAVNSDCIFLNNPGLLVAPQVRSQVKIGNVVKDPAKLSVKELLHLGVIEDFYEPLLENLNVDSTESIVYLQNATFADKSTHYLIGYDVSKLTLPSRKTLKTTLREILDEQSPKELEDYIRNIRKLRINKLTKKLISDYKTVFLTDGVIRPDIDQTELIKVHPNFVMNSLEDIDEFLKYVKYKGSNLTIRTLTDLFVDRGVQFDEEIYAYAPKNKALGKARVNETIMNWYNTFNSPKLFEERLNKSRQQFINNLQNNRVEWNKHDSPTFATIAQRYSNWTDSVTGNIILSKDGKLHPVLEAYFLSDVLLSNEYNTVTIGEIWAHPNKNKRLTNDNPEVGEVGTYEEFSEANRLIAQIKRSVAFGATWHPFTQNLFNGVAPTINVAVMSDVKTVVPTPNGTSDGVAEVDSMDGSGYAHPLQSRFENNSLLSAGVGVNKKTIMMDVDYRTNKPILLKWAVYAINNAIRRIGTNSAIDAENLYMKMSNKLLNKKVDLHEAFISYGKPIYFYSNETGEYFKIKDITSGVINGVMLADRLLVKVNPYTGEEITEEYWESDLNGEEGRQMPINTLYDIDQLFGGAWTCDWNAETKQFDWNEANLDALEYLLSKKENQDLKDKFIGYAVNKSAIKVGAGNVNPDTAWSDDSELYTIPMNTKYGGIQMDFDHDLDDADVTEMTQMLSSLVENGYYLGIVGSIYEDIGKIAAKHIEKLSGPITVLDSPETTAIDKQDAKSRLYTELGKALFRAFKENNRDTLGLAQSFLELAKRAIKENNLDYKIPFSAATINGIFVSDVIADINRGGIRHKYSGFAGVLNPSYNVIQTYRVFNPTTGKYEVRMYKELCDFARKNGLQSMRDLKSIFVNDNLNPLMREVTDINTIEFEDTVVIFRPDRKVEGPYYINNFTKFDDLKLRLRVNPNLRVFVHQGYGRNLRGAETRFIVNGKTYSIYDLDSVRASQYIVYLMDKKPLIAEQSALVTKVLGAGWETDLNTSLSRARAITQQQLKSAEEQGFISNSEAFQLGNENTAVPIQGFYTRPAEIVTGRYQGENFGLNQHDHIWQIQDSKFFKDKLTDKFTYPTNVPSELYDVVLFEGDKPWLIKIGNEEISSKVMSETGNIYDNTNITYNNDDVVYNDNILINKEGFKFKEYKDKNGNRYNVIFVENIDRYRQLLKSGIFNKHIELFNITDINLDVLKNVRFGNASVTKYINDAGQEVIFDVNLLSKGQFEDIEIRNREIFEQQQAQRMYDAFKKQLMYVAARIPTQAMQSFMPEEIIAYADVDTALCFVSASQTMLEGSDYDADKSFMMTYSISNNGYLDMGEDDTDDFYGDQLRNRVVDRILDITLRPQNQLIAQIPINMSAQQDAAAASALGRSELHITSDNPETKFMMQVQNMVGKEVIGISAVSLKAFFALSYYYGTLLEDLKQKCRTFDPNNIEDCNVLINSFRKLLIYNPINQEVTSLANINIQSVLDVIGNDGRFDNIPFTNDGNTTANKKLTEWSNGVMFSTTFGRNVAFINLRQALNDLLIRVNREDAALADSGLISAATDEHIHKIQK